MFNFWLIYCSAYEILGLSTLGVSLQQLETILPDKFGHKFQNNNIRNRLKIEALYQASILEQQDDIDRVELDQSLLIPSDIDYTQYNIIIIISQ